MSDGTAIGSTVPAWGAASSTPASLLASDIGNDSLVGGATVRDALNTLLAAIGTGEVVVTVPFSFATPSPLILSAVGPTNLVDTAKIVVVTAFDPGVRVRLGTAADPNRILDVAMDLIDAQFVSEALTLFPVPDVLQLEHDPSLAGTGVLLYKLAA